MKLVVLASGRGSNFEAIAQGIVDNKIPNTQILALITDNPNAEAIERAIKFGIPRLVIDPAPTRAAFEKTLVETLEKLPFDYLCLAGYMKILGAAVVEKWPNQILNIHPSLLPLFPGLRAQRQALEAGMKTTGCTVHIVTKDLDAGPILGSRSLEIGKNETEKSLTDRLLPLEHECYVETLARLAKQNQPKK